MANTHVNSTQSAHQIGLIPKRKSQSKIYEILRTYAPKGKSDHSNHKIS